MLPTLHDNRVTLRPLEDDDLERLGEIVSVAGVREWWGYVGDPPKLRDDLINDGAAFAIEIDGKLGRQPVDGPTGRRARRLSPSRSTTTRGLTGGRGRRNEPPAPAAHGQRAARPVAPAGSAPATSSGVRPPAESTP